MPLTTKPRLERLEDRLALSGFAPDDGAYLVENWVGQYNDVKIRPSDQAIVAVGNETSNGNAIKMAAERYDALGNVDSTFGTGGQATIAAPAGYTGSYAWGMTIQPDVKTVLAGDFVNISPGVGPHYRDTAVARLTANGQLDAGFGNSGRAIINTGVNSEAVTVASQSTGKLIVGGDSGNFGQVARVTSGGVLDTGKKGFGDIQKGSAIGYHSAREINASASAQWTTFNSAVVQPDDKVVAVGTRVDLVNGQYVNRLVLAQYTADGAVDTTFNHQTVGSGWTQLLPAGMSGSQGFTVALQPDGKIIVAGGVYGGGTSNMLVARYTASGMLDTTFGAGAGYLLLGIDGAAFAGSVVVQPDGKIVLASDRQTASGSVLVARLNPDGALDASFGGAGYKLRAPAADQLFGPIGAIALQADGNIIVAGIVDQIDPSSGRYVDHPLLMRFYGGNTAPAAPAASSTTTTTSATDAALLLLMTDDPLTTTKRK